LALGTRNVLISKLEWIKERAEDFVIITVGMVFSKSIRSLEAPK